LRTLHRYLWWICLTLLAVSAPHRLLAEQTTPSLASHVSAPALAQAETLPDLLDICTLQLHNTPASVTAFGRGVHLFRANDEDAAPRLHRRAGLRSVPFSAAESPMSAALQLPALSMGESPAKNLPTGRAPPAV